VRRHHETIQRGVETVHPVDMSQSPPSVREPEFADAIVDFLAIVAIASQKEVDRQPLRKRLHCLEEIAPTLPLHQSRGEPDNEGPGRRTDGLTALNVIRCTGFLPSTRNGVHHHIYLVLGL